MRKRRMVKPEELGTRLFASAVALSWRAQGARYGAKVRLKVSRLVVSSDAVLSMSGALCTPFYRSLHSIPGILFLGATLVPHWYFPPFSRH